MFKELINQYNKYKFIPATKNIIYHFLTRERKKSYGNQNHDKIFYVIRSIDNKSPFYIGPVNNLLANYFYVLSHIKYAELNGWIPIVDQLNYPVYNSVDYPVNGSMNAWEYFWQQPCKYSLDEIYNSKNVILSKQNWIKEWDMGYELNKYYDKPFIHMIHEVGDRVKLKDGIYEYINTKSNEIFNGRKNILGVSFRFGGHSKHHYASENGHPIQPDIEVLIKTVKKYLKKWNMQYIFFTSDTEEAVVAFNNSFWEEVIVLSRKRFSEKLKKGEKNVLYDKKYINKTSLDYLTEMELLAKCDCLIGSINSGLRYALVKNDNQYKFVKILNSGFLPFKIGR